MDIREDTEADQIEKATGGPEGEQETLSGVPRATLAQCC